RFGYAQQRARRGRLEVELDERGRLLGVVYGRVDRIGMPVEREVPFGLHLDDLDLEGQVLVAGIGDLSARPATGHERAFEVDAEPLAELAMVGQGSPDADGRGIELDLFFDAIGGRGR